MIVLGYDLAIPVVRPDSEQRFIYRLESAVRSYEHDYDALPPADRIGSAPLVKALTALSPSGQRHLFVEPGMLDAQGNLLTPEGRIVHYQPGPAGTRLGFTLWAGDARGNPTGATKLRR